MNKFTLTCNIGQKNKEILELIKESLNLGHIRQDKRSDCWVYTISDKEGIRFILDFFSAKPTNLGLCTVKKNDLDSFKHLLYNIDCKFHLKKSPKYLEVENLVKKFKERHIKPTVQVFYVIYL